MDPVLEFFGDMFGQWWTPEAKVLFQANNLNAHLALMSEENFPGLPDYESLLPTVRVPCLFYMGEAESDSSYLQKWVKRMPNATFIPLPDLDHIEAGSRIDLVLPHIT